MKQILSAVACLAFSLQLWAMDPTGTWSGNLSIQNQSLRFVLHIKKEGTNYLATMDSPDQGAKGIQMSHVTVEDSMLTVELRIAQMKYVGKMDDKSIKGNFFQAGQTFPLVLTKVQQTVSENNTNSVEPNAAYLETAVSLQTQSGKIVGTLTTPKTFNKGPIAIIIAGSGPTDRNGNNPTMTNDAYKKMALELAKKGIATLRYDKRGIAGSVAVVENEADLIFTNYATDAKNWIEWLRQDKRFTKVWIIGHSEGSLIGMIAAEKADGYISIAGAGRPIGEVLKEQLRTQPPSMQDQAAVLIDSLSKGLKVNNTDPTLQPLFRQSIQPYMMSWLKLNPQTELKKLKIPVMIVQGTTDIQVTMDDAKRLAEAKPNAKLLVLDKMNHILRTVEGDREANLNTYNNPALPLAEGLISGISAFMLQK